MLFEQYLAGKKYYLLNFNLKGNCRHLAKFDAHEKTLSFLGHKW